MKYRLPVILLLLSLCTAACDRGELPVASHDAGDVVTIQVEMGEDYWNQIFYDMGTQSIVSQNLKDIWDLGFEASESGNHIILNTARFSAVSISETTDFSAVTDRNDAIWRNDASNGDLENTAFGEVKANGEIRIIDRGYNSGGTHSGYKKMQVTLTTSTAYQVKVANLDGSEENVIDIPKDATRNFIAVSLDGNTVVEVEPENTSWDLLFTQYTNIFEDPPLAYLVAGVVSNHGNVQLADASEKSFDEISLEDVGDYTFTDEIDLIGYDWKEFDLNTGLYTVFPEKNYLLYDTEGRYFKMHFIDFYTENGVKGAPQMEIQEL